MVNVVTELTEGIRRLQKLNKEMSEIELKEETLNLRQLLMDAKEALLNEKERVAELEKKLAALTSGDPCPLCAALLKVVKSTPHHSLGRFGVQQLTLRCSSCSHVEQRMRDPAGVTKG